ncbi:RICIN domain-containing protein [Parahaliea mediterranea]|uniref:RICIN domain-containing protein n=1 Tax=Parahaliea mediterranea TaxID=651086 RepID=A0A939DGW9_9GAMM|nr:RICIN domain-containing protein [Parahaliea mediterranea]MBN7797833.1 RICIN domain-containing protein [Parahaliea mediterranea]
MKHATLLAGLLGLWVAGAAAIEFNTDAIKKMQEEGEKIMEEEKAFRAFKLPNGQCLQAAGNPSKAGVKLVSRKCNDKAQNQKWQFDKQGRLASHGGACVGLAGDGKEAGASAVLKNCGGAGDQKWSLDGAGRLHNKGGLCLEAQGGQVQTAPCSKAANQKWG